MQPEPSQQYYHQQNHDVFMLSGQPPEWRSPSPVHAGVFVSAQPKIEPEPAPVPDWLAQEPQPQENHHLQHQQPVPTDSQLSQQLLQQVNVQHNTEHASHEQMQLYAFKGRTLYAHTAASPSPHTSSAQHTALAQRVSAASFEPQREVPQSMSHSQHAPGPSSASQLSWHMHAGHEYEHQTAAVHRIKAEHQIKAEPSDSELHPADSALHTGSGLLDVPSTEHAQHAHKEYADPNVNQQQPSMHAALPKDQAAAQSASAQQVCVHYASLAPLLRAQNYLQNLVYACMQVFFKALRSQM